MNKIGQTIVGVALGVVLVVVMVASVFNTFKVINFSKRIGTLEVSNYQIDHIAAAKFLDSDKQFNALLTELRNKKLIEIPKPEPVKK